jgi:holin-like protein
VFEMIAAFAGLIFCQWIGELLSRAFGLPLPGPVLGMGLLFFYLLLRGGGRGHKGDAGRAVPAGLASVADGLLGHLSILFVPAAVGVMRYFDLLRANALPAIAALALSTILAMAVTALTFRLLAPAPKQEAQGE